MTIPASQVASVTPGVLAAGGNGISLNGLFLTQNLAMPTGQVLSFPSTTAVNNFFGPASAEYALSLIYFGGYTNSTIKPSAMLFAPYNAAARAAFLVSGSFANITLTQLEAIAPGTLTINFDGAPLTSASIDLSAATSFTNAASIIEAAFTDPGFTVSWNAVTSTFQFTDATTGSSSTIVFATGAISASLLLTSATGATLSQGAIADTPESAMENAVAVSQNWVSMVPLIEPSLADKEGFAAWFTAQDNEYCYLAWDSDVQASVANATEPFGVAAKAAQYNGVMCIGGDPAAVPVGSTLAALTLNVATFIAGAIASVNTQQSNGRVTFAFLAQAGIIATCANETTAANLLANGYSFYGAYATRNQGFTFFYNGNMPGEFPWLDQLINQIWMSDQFQVTLVSLYTTAGSIPYNDSGYSLVRAALLGPITAAVNFGAIRSGVTLSPAQIEEVNAQAGQAIDSILNSQGWYLQILDPGATARQNRATPIINFWFTDGGSIQQIQMDSIDIL